MPAPVARAFEAFPAPVRRRLRALRALVFETASATDEVGRLEETLKWGQPAYLTSETGAGTTIRLGWKASDPDTYRMFVHCQTDLIARFRDWFADDLEFEGDRAVVFRVAEPLPAAVASRCIEAALTYHRDKKRDRAR